MSVAVVFFFSFFLFVYLGDLIIPEVFICAKLRDCFDIMVCSDIMYITFFFDKEGIYFVYILIFFLF